MQGQTTLKCVLRLFRAPLPGTIVNVSGGSGSFTKRRIHIGQLRRRYNGPVRLKSKTLNSPETDRPQHGRPVASVIAQQYSSDIRVSLRVHSQLARLKIFLFQSPAIFFFLNKMA